VTDGHLDPVQCIIIPYYCGHEELEEEIDKDLFLHFVGRANHPKRVEFVDALSSHFQDKPNAVTFYQTFPRHKYNEEKKLLDRSIFALCPRGRTKTTRRVFSGLASRCINVIQVDGSLPFPFASLLDPEEFALFHHEGRPIEELFEKMCDPDVIKTLQKNVEIQRLKYLYHYPQSKPGDAFHMLLRALNHRG